MTTVLEYPNLSLVPEWAIQWYKENDICEYIVSNFEGKEHSTLYNINEIAETLLQFHKGNDNKLVKRIAPKAEKVCTDCGSDMKLKSGKYGYFYGCTNFPKCRKTERYN